MDFLKQELSRIYNWDPIQREKARLFPKTTKFLYDPIVDMERFVGIEIEVENMRGVVEVNPYVWIVKEDGSLRNNGVEFVTVPIKGDEVRYAVENVFAHLPAKADFSARTSMHVHVNTRDFTLEQVLNVILLYLVFEKLLYRFAGPNRYKNIFCIPIQETKLPAAIANFLVHEHLPGLVREWQKYSGMNLLPLRPQGTIEFRHMEGHREPERLIHWVNILLTMFKSAKTWSFENLFNRIKRLNSTSFYEQFLYEIFGEQSIHLIGPNLQGLMENGVSTIKAITLPNPFIQSVLLSLNNDSSLLRALGVSKDYGVKLGIKPVKAEDALRHLVRGIELRFDQNAVRIAGDLQFNNLMLQDQPAIQFDAPMDYFEPVPVPEDDHQ